MLEPIPQLDAAEARVAGSLIEKAMTTPDHYPMSLNAVRVACNQVSNRDPVLDLAEDLVERVLRALADRGLARMVHRPGDRVVKYRHAVDEVLGLTAKETALMAVLLLRGAQTPGELRQRTQRYIEFESLPEVEATLEGMRGDAERSPLVERLDRQPGQKEHRYRELLTSGAAGPASAGDDDAPPEIGGEEDDGGGEVAALRAEVADLRAKIERIADELGLDLGG